MNNSSLQLTTFLCRLSCWSKCFLNASCVSSSSVGVAVCERRKLPTVMLIDVMYRMCKQPVGMQRQVDR